MNFYEILTKRSKNHKTLKHSVLYYFSFICLVLIFIYKGYSAPLLPDMHLPMKASYFITAPSLP